MTTQTKEQLEAAEAEAERIRVKAAKINHETAREQIIEHLCTTHKISKAQAEVVIADEYDRPFARQPTLSADGKSVIRTTKKGEVIDMLADGGKYWSENYADILPKPKLNEGEIAMTRATVAISNMTIQSIMVKEYGVEHTASLLKLAGGKLGEIVTPKKPGAPQKTDAPDDNTPPRTIEGATNKNNPWSPNFVGGKDKAATERARIIKANVRFAESLAKAANARIDGRPIAAR